MKGDNKVIEYLNRGLRSELTAINQYWLHYRILDNWGYKELAKQWRKESIEEMGHADRFVDRILFLDGFPNMQVLDPLRRYSMTLLSPFIVPSGYTVQRNVARRGDEIQSV